MRAVIIIFTILLALPAWSRSCRQFDNVAEYLNTQKFIRASRDHRALRREPQLNLGDINQAKTLSYRFPAFKDLGFGVPGGQGWSPYIGRHPRSVLNGKRIGWETRNQNGHARVRLDWDPEKGAHYNIEILDKTNGRNETHKLAVSFLCGERKCTEQQVLRMADRMQ